MIYECIESFELDKYDDNGFSTDEMMEIEKSSLWELNDDGGNIIGAEHHLDNLDGSAWIEITAIISKNILRRYPMPNELTPQEIAESLEKQDLYPVARLDKDRKALRQGASYMRKSASGELKPAVHGHWVDTDFVNSTGEIYECNNCHKFYNPEKKAVSLGRQAKNPTYCPSCGALMDGKDDSHETD